MAMPVESSQTLAIQVIRRLREAGHEALLAGGCVRDMLLRLAPADFDVATSATPDQVQALFRRVHMVGAKFGVAMVLEGRQRIEVTTFRSDVSYSDGRRPDAVAFTSAREDALRRDFTINGMFYDPLAEQVVDYVGGQQDLRAGLIRAIGEPERRFAEDYLRMLRAVRFSQRFGFALEPATAAAIRHHAPKITQISGERIREEMEKMLGRPSAGRAVGELHELGLLPAILPELYATGRSAADAQPLVHAVAGDDYVLPLAALLAGLTKDELEALAERWGMSNAARDLLSWLIAHLDDWRTMARAPLAELKRLLAREHFVKLEHLWRARERLVAGGQEEAQAIRRRIEQIDPAHIAPPPLVTGEALKQLGLTEGPELGRILAAVYDAQLNETIRTREEALALARELIGSGK